jgi:hypothetical protein
MNNNIKKILTGVVLISCLVLLTGCGTKKSINVEQFTKIAKEKEYEVVDISKQYESYGYIKSGTVALSNKKWQVEFYVLEDETGSKNMYNVNKNKFKQEQNGSKTYSEINMKNYDTYTLKANDQYMYISRVNNTLIYCNVQAKYEKDAKAFIKALGY